MVLSAIEQVRSDDPADDEDRVEEGDVPVLHDVLLGERE
jgi:hypothetical protein